MRVLADEIVRRARALAGCRFRPQGRDPATGLDCVGVVLWSCGIASDGVPRDYRLRGAHRDEIESQLGRHFRRIAKTKRGAGDVVLCSVSANHVHLAVCCRASFVHADARLRRVVETPGSPQWPILGVFRARTSTES